MSASAVLAKVFFVLFALFSFTFPLAAAAPGHDDTLDARATWKPKILYPHEGTVWYRGQTHSIVWDVKGAPSNANGCEILLRKANKTTPVILAKGFDKTSGRTVVKVPWVEDGDDYQIVFCKGSGNYSPYFTIDQ